MKKILNLCMLLLLAACSTVPLTGRKQMLLLSDSELLSASLTQYNQYIRKATKSSNKAQTDKVIRVGKKIAGATEAYLRQNGMEKELSNFQWEFNLIKDKQVNAFCMPGGKIVVYEGLLDIASSDDELGVVLGHEVAHAVAKHSNERMSQGLLVQFGGAIMDAALSEKSAAMQQIGATVFGLGAQLGIMLPFSRKHESEADHMGLVFMTMAGYDPSVAVTFWEKMDAAGGGSPPEILSTHPSNATRISAIKRRLPEMEKYKRKSYKKKRYKNSYDKKKNTKNHKKK